MTGARGTRSARPRRLAVLITASATILLAGIGGCTVPSGGDPTEPQPGQARAVPLGAFLGPGADGVGAIAAFESWLGVAVTVGHTYLPGGTWADVEGPDWVLDPWSAWRTARPDRMLVLNVPMLAPNEPALGDTEVARLLRQGADGAYDGHFRTLAERLVARGATDTVIVLGWEMNGTSFSSRCGPNPLAWKQYWRRIVTTMRAVPGHRFRFDFTPVRGTQAIPWSQCYPGDEVVDIVGLDSYDMHPGRTFADFVDQPYGLRAQADFAEAHAKPMSYPEWGLFEYGDNVDYLRGMYTWFSTHNVAYQTVTDYCPHGVWRCSVNPASGEAYRRLFGVTGPSPRRGR